MRPMKTTVQTITNEEALARLRELIEVHGGMYALGRAIGASGQVVQMWVRRKSVPLPWRIVMQKTKVKK